MNILQKIPFVYLPRIGVFCCLMWLTFNSVAQNYKPSDCRGALPFCDPFNEGLGKVLDIGDIENEVNPNISCVDHENYSTWYKFTPTTDGTFNFVLTPNDGADDYDWALFDITGSSCDQIPIDGDLLISCNSWGDFNWNGQTGISSANGGLGTSNGPGTFNGPPFNADQPVTAGHNYVLMVSNWSNSTQGFTINTSASTADGIYAETNLTVPQDQTICPGDTVQIWSNVTGSFLAPLQYNWTPEGLFVDPTVSDPELISPLEESVRVNVSVDNGGCETTAGIDIEVGTINYNKNNKNQDICIGEVSKLNINFSGNVIPPGLSFSWSPGNLLDDSTRLVPTTIPLEDTTQFTFTIKNGPCEITDSLLVFVYYDTVSADFDYSINDNELTIPVEVDFSNLSVGDFENHWNFGDGTESTDRSPPQHGFPGYDTYTVKLVAISASGACIDTAVKVIEFPEVVYPNIITPNSDGVNDVLRVTGLKPGTGLSVYNRWGRLVFKEEDYLHDWDAFDQPNGMYFFEYNDPDGNLTKGWIEVTR